MCRVKITIRGDSRRAGVVENALRDLPGLELFSQDKHTDTNMKTKTDDLDSNYSNTDDGNTDDGNTDVLNDDYDRQLSSFSSPPQACPFTMSDFDSDDQDQLHTQQDSDEDLDRTPTYTCHDNVHGNTVTKIKTGHQFYVHHNVHDNTVTKIKTERHFYIHNNVHGTKIQTEHHFCVPCSLNLLLTWTGH